MNRHELANALDAMAIPQLAMLLRRAASPWLTVLTYHRVAAPSAGGGAEWTHGLDDGVVDVTADQLDRQLRFVKRWFHPIGVGELFSFVHAGKALPPNPVLITFDDGYRDNHDIALPILARYGVPATFFVATDYVKRRRLFWWDRLALVIKRSPRNRLEVDYPEPLRLPLDDLSAKRGAIVRLERIVKDHVGLDLERFIDGVEHAAAVSLGFEEERRLADENVMTWTHVAALRRAGMDVQSHTRTHRVLQTLDAEQLANELHGSRVELEAVLGERVRALSYPVGKSVRAAPHLRRAVRDAGYQLGFSNGTGVNRMCAFDPFDARRVSLDLAIGDAFFRAMLALPCVGY
jgi:peptidoglycan/xylan/chitin deacetylase (PgdA/CDA1 family)